MGAQRTIAGILLGIFLPWAIIFALAGFVYTDQLAGWINATGGIPLAFVNLQFYAILCLNAITFNINLPIFGPSFVLVIFAWVFTGFLIGVLTESPKQSALLVLVGILANLMGFFILNLITGGIPAEVVNAALAPLMPSLTNLIFPLLNLFIYAAIITLVIPSGLFGGLLGAVMNRKKES